MRRREAIIAYSFIIFAFVISISSIPLIIGTMTVFETERGLISVGNVEFTVGDFSYIMGALAGSIALALFLVAYFIPFARGTGRR